MYNIGFEGLNLQLNEAQFANEIYEVTKEVGDFFARRGIVNDDLTPVPRRRKYPQDYPLEWTPQERKAYFRKVRKGRTTFPYQRTGKLLEGWQQSVRPTQRGAVMRVRNDVSYAPGVIGTFRSKTRMKLYHAITGWQPVMDRFPLYGERVSNSVSQGLRKRKMENIVRAV